MTVKCLKCHSTNTTRFEWARQKKFEYWTCWDCDYLFTVKLVYKVGAIYFGPHQMGWSEKK